MLKNINTDEAAAMLLSIPVKTQTETVSLRKARGRVLAENIAAVVTVPPFARSPYDGYAFMGADTENASRENPAVFEITEELPAGTAPTIEITRGKAAKILTGAPVPDGADAIIKYEDTEFTDKQVKVFEYVKPGANIVKAGEDIALGETVARRGDILSSALTGMLAGQGIAQVRVYKIPAVTIINTGSELLSVGEAPRPAKIYNSNLYTIGALVSDMGAQYTDGGIAADDAQTIAGMISKALEASDMVITTGGASVGDYDYAVRAAEMAGAEVLFWKADMKPGGSILAAVKDGKLILSLSGNPGAAAVGLMRIAAPFIKKLCGRGDVFYETVYVKMKTDYGKKSPKMRLMRGRLSVEDGQAFFVTNEGQGNGVVSSLVKCDLLAEVPAGTGGLKAGDIVKAYRVQQ